MPEITTLSQRELLALALDASQREDRGHCMVYLKEAVARPDATAEACFLLGSEYAQLQLMDDAKRLMHQALEIRPGLGIARFQLGLLYLTDNQAAEAQSVWGPLAELGEGEALRAFHQGMLHLIRDEFADTLRWLERGTGLNTVNPALNHDMQMIMDRVRELQAQAATVEKTEPEDKKNDEEEGHHLFLHAYQLGKSH